MIFLQLYEVNGKICDQSTFSFLLEKQTFKNSSNFLSRLEHLQVALNVKLYI